MELSTLFLHAGIYLPSEISFPLTLLDSKQQRDQNETEKEIVVLISIALHCILLPCQNLYCNSIINSSVTETGVLW